VQPTRPTNEARPRLVVAYGEGSVDAMAVGSTARGLCELLWLIDGENAAARAVRPLLERLGTVIDAFAAGPEEIASALEPHAPTGIITFFDTRMEELAQAAERLGLEFHSPEVAVALQDKLRQREALRTAGLPTPAILDLPAELDGGDVARLADSVRFPAVLKPRRASGSWHTFPVAGAGALAALWDELSAGPPEARVLEEYLPDGPPMPGGFEADYVSVETVAAAGRTTHVAVTGRFPLAPPLRETGFFIPSTLDGEQTAVMLELADRALAALGVRTGCAHTEIKLTADGPRIIEVNGRMGGGVPDMLRLATGTDMMALAMRAALGLEPTIAEPPVASAVGYRFFFQPPVSARRVLVIDGLDRLKLLPGVESVVLRRPLGSDFDAREGSRAHVFAVVGSAPDYAGMLAVDAFLRREIVATYEHA
jgi:biotin carboxylase